MKKGMKLLLLLIIIAAAYGIAYTAGIIPGGYKASINETISSEEGAEVGGVEAPETEDTEVETPVAEVEPEENLKEESLVAEQEDFVSGLAELREENDQEKEFVPDIVINPEDSTITVGDQVQESAVQESDGEQVIDSGALEEIFEDTGLVVPEGEQVSVDEVVESNNLDMTTLEDGTILLENTYQTCRIIVKIEDSVTEALSDEKASGVVGPFNGTYIFQYDSEELAAAACEYWNADDRVAYAEPEAVISVKTKTSKTTASAFSYTDYRTWGTSACGFKHMKQMVTKSYGSSKYAPKVKVAVIDTGIDYNHPLFKNRLLSKGYDFVNGDSNATDDYFHGTACSGIIAQNTTKNVKILPLKAGDSNGSLTNLDIYNALEYCIKKKVDIVNMSFGCLDSNYSRVMKEGIDDARAAGLLLIGAYGNNGVKTVYHMPACFAGVIGVSSVNEYKKLSDFSNYGKKVDLSAPGEYIYCAVPEFYDDFGYCYMSGTSMSAPYVAAAAALFKTLHPKYSAAKITSLLKKYVLDLGKEGKDIRFGEGMIYLKKVKAVNR